MTTIAFSRQSRMICCGEISQLEDAVDVVSSVSEQVPQVEVTINRQAASQYGLTAASIGSGSPVGADR